jgi:hypothetical protein
MKTGLKFEKKLSSNEASLNFDYKETENRIFKIN